jgi:hypothetical protein
MSGVGVAQGVQAQQRAGSGVGAAQARAAGAGGDLAPAGLSEGELANGDADRATDPSVASTGPVDAGADVAANDTAGSAVTKDGGLAAGDVSSAMQGEWPVFLQSESEGTLMVWPDANPQMIDAPALELAMVEGQMQGTPVADSIAEELTGKGYAVYRREWGDWYGEFVLWEGATA